MLIAHLLKLSTSTITIVGISGVTIANGVPDFGEDTPEAWNRWHVVENILSTVVLTHPAFLNNTPELLVSYLI